MADRTVCERGTNQIAFICNGASAVSRGQLNGSSALAIVETSKSAFDM